MPTYRITIDARRTVSGYSGPDATHVFDRYVQAPTALAARRSLTSRRWVADNDGAEFSEWTIARTRRVPVVEVVTTDSSAWHSNGIAGIRVFYSKSAANVHLRRLLAQCTPGEGAFRRIVSN